MKLSFFKSLDRISEFSLQLLIMGTVLGCGLYAMALIIFIYFLLYQICYKLST